MINQSTANHRFHRMYSEGESNLYSYRIATEKAEQYYDGVQWTGVDAADLDQRGQHPVVLNVIKSAIESLMGVYFQREIDMQPVGVESGDDRLADVLLELLKHIDRLNDEDYYLSQMFMNGAKVGSSWLEVGYGKFGTNKTADVFIAPRTSYEMGYDPFAKSPVLTDARYIYRKVAMDLDEAQDRFPKFADKLKAFFHANLHNSIEFGQEGSALRNSSGQGAVYLDSDGVTHRRVYIIELQYRDVEGVYRKIPFIGDMFLDHDSKTKFDPKGPPDEENQKLNDVGYFTHIPFFARRTMKGVPAGLVADVISLQDLVNSLISKWEWQVNSNQVILESGAVENLDIMREQLHKPDGVIEVNAGALQQNIVQFRGHIPEATHMMEVMRLIVSQMFQVMGINDALRGVGGINSRSFAQESQRLEQAQGQHSSLFNNFFYSQRQLERVKLYELGKNYRVKDAARILGVEKSEAMLGINGNLKLFQSIQDLLRWDIHLTEAPPFDTSRERIMTLAVELGKSGVMPAEIISELFLSNLPIPNRDDLLEKMQALITQQSAAQQQATANDQLAQAGFQPQLTSV